LSCALPKWFGGPSCILGVQLVDALKQASEIRQRSGCHDAGGLRRALVHEEPGGPSFVEFQTQISERQFIWVWLFWNDE
jgi:hypothetical protein